MSSTYKSDWTSIQTEQKICNYVGWLKFYEIFFFSGETGQHSYLRSDGSDEVSVFNETILMAAD